jgi:uncharacterized Zn finger protein
MRLLLKLFSKFSLTIFLVTTSCGYLEDDGIDYQETISGNILVQKDRNSQEYALVLKESEQIYDGLILNCDSAFYDSKNQIIWIKSIINDYNNSYYEIKVLDSLATRVWLAIQKKEISRQDFIKNTNQKVAKWTRINN